MQEVRMPTWETSPWGTKMLAVPGKLWRETVKNSAIRTLVEMHGMKNRLFTTAYPPDRDVVLLIPKVYYTYSCEHADEVTKPECPHCGAMVIAWQ